MTLESARPVPPIAVRHQAYLVLPSFVATCLIFQSCGSLTSDADKAKVAEIAAKIDSAEAVKQYPLRGQVQRLDPTDKIATIKHEAIGDWMGAMTMEFPVKDTADFLKLKEGSPLEATVFVQGINFWLGEVKPTVSTAPTATK